MFLNCLLTETRETIEVGSNSAYKNISMTKYKSIRAEYRKIQTEDAL